MPLRFRVPARGDQGAGELESIRRVVTGVQEGVPVAANGLVVVLRGHFALRRLEIEPSALLSFRLERARVVPRQNEDHGHDCKYGDEDPR